MDRGGALDRSDKPHAGAIQHPDDGYIQPADLTQALAKGVLDNVKSGSIVLMHDGGGGNARQPGQVASPWLWDKQTPAPRFRRDSRTV